ncbi:MAG: hypothetical protein V4477_13885 [Pseudomonadota bacterium]
MAELATWKARCSEAFHASNILASEVRAQHSFVLWRNIWQARWR